MLRRARSPRLLKAIVIVVSLVVAISFGFQIIGVWFLVPLHWRQSSDSAVAATIGWTLLSISIAGPAALLLASFCGVPARPTFGIGAAVVAAVAIAYGHRFLTEVRRSRVVSASPAAGGDAET